MQDTTGEAAQPRKAPVQARSRDRFERILEAATALIAQSGVEPVRMSELAATAEISIASLYQYFPDKAAVVATLANRLNEQGQQCVRQAFANVRDANDLLGALFSMIDDYYACFLHVPGAFAIWQASQSDTRLQALDREDVEGHVRTISSAIGQAFPGMVQAETWRLGRLFTGVIGTAVRTAATLPHAEGSALVTSCKNALLEPAVRDMIGRELSFHPAKPVGG